MNTSVTTLPDYCYYIFDSFNDFTNKHFNIFGYVKDCSNTPILLCLLTAVYRVKGTVSKKFKAYLAIDHFHALPLRVKGRRIKGLFLKEHSAQCSLNKSLGSDPKQNALKKVIF